MPATRKKRSLTLTGRIRECALRAEMWVITADYNLRKQGKKALATLPFIRQWRFHLKFRSVIERHFAWTKRYFDLETVRWKGLCAAYQHTALIYSVMLGVALTAHRFMRPLELPNPILKA